MFRFGNLNSLALACKNAQLEGIFRDAGSEAGSSVPHGSQAFVLLPVSPSAKRRALGDIYPVNRKRTNGIVVELNAGQWNQATPSHRFHYGYYSREYTPLQIQEHFVRSAVDWRWKHKDGIQLDKELNKALNDDMAKSKSSGKKSDEIDIDTLGRVILSLLSFLYPGRKGKMKAKALVDYLFKVILKQHATYFEDAMIVKNRQFCRDNVMLSYKIQQTIDTQPTGGLNVTLAALTA